MSQRKLCAVDTWTEQANLHMCQSTCSAKEQCVSSTAESYVYCADQNAAETSMEMNRPRTVRTGCRLLVE
jgi:hypothetical protein